MNKRNKQFLVFIFLVIFSVVEVNYGLSNYSENSKDAKIDLIASVEARNMGGDLGCPDLANCSGSATCGTAGTVSSCTIVCEDGPTIVCKGPGSTN